MSERIPIVQPTVIRTVVPTPFLRRAGGALRQIARLAMTYSGPAQTGEVHVTAQGVELVTPVTLEPGETTLEVDMAEVTAPGEIDVVLVVAGNRVAQTVVPWTPPKHWVVHVVHLSHHDVGYTDLASHVIPEHDRWLDAVIDMAEATHDFPEEARFRAVIEQSWSIDHFLRHARPERAAAMLDLLRRGDAELTALFGNMVTELCGHETLARSVYHAFRLRREYGIPIVSAEHNDIPGFSWGLSQVLTEAGVSILCPGLPKYYSWGHPGAPSFWDEAAIFGAEGMPGAFWWEAPGGKRVLFWCNNQGCGGGCDPRLPALAGRLEQLQACGYPYPVLRWPVSGGARDNSPYIEGYAHTIREWNARWAFPRLVSSTNARFYRDLLPQLPATLPVFRGELPGQDYPVGAASTAVATGVNRRNHADLPAAEALATMAGALTDYRYPAARIFQAYEEVLWHDEHTWGHHFPAGPTASAAELEKAIHAHCAAALTHDVANQAMARVADAVRLDEPGIHLVVFNPLPYARSAKVSTPLRELDNCGSTMAHTAQGTLRGVLLHDRWHAIPPPDLVAGKFDLVDVATGTLVPYQIDVLSSPFEPLPYAAQRLGLGAGGKRYGVFEGPASLLRTLVFHADAVPALGYRTYCLRPRPDRPTFAAQVNAAARTLENAFYRLELDPDRGFVRSLIDKGDGSELIAETAAHPFGAIVVRTPHGNETIGVCQGVQPGSAGPLQAALRVTYAAPGHPQIEVTYTLHAREKRLDVAVALLKDPTPLLETYVAFPFAMPHGRFRYEAPLCIVDPSRDLMPGAYADRLTVQNWIAVSDGQRSVLWSSHDAAVVSLGRLWPGRVSPAHSAVVRADLVHPPQTADDLRGGAIYSLLTANNFGTNFAVAQSGALLFRYSLTSAAGVVSDAEAARCGREFLTPLQTIFTEHPGPRPLAPADSFLAIEPPAVQLLALKRAENGQGLIVRLWNASAQDVAARLSLPCLHVVTAVLTSLAEEDYDGALELLANGVVVPLPAAGIVTVRLNPEGMSRP